MTEPIRIGAKPTHTHPPQPQVKAPEPEQGIEANIDALVLGGVLERTVEPFPNWKVTMHSLTNDERVRSSKDIPNDLLGSVSASQEAVKLPTLVWAITFIEVNGVAKHFSQPEDKEGLRILLNSSPSIIVDVLYMEYCKIINDLIVLVETAVKKN